MLSPRLPWRGDAHLDLPGDSAGLASSAFPPGLRCSWPARPENVTQERRLTGSRQGDPVCGSMTVLDRVQPRPTGSQITRGAGGLLTGLLAEVMGEGPQSFSGQRPIP